MTPDRTLSRVEAALIVAATLLPKRPAMLPIFERLEAELATLKDARNDPYARARALVRGAA